VLALKNALCQRMKRIWQAQQPFEPKTLADVEIPLMSWNMFNGELFVVKDLLSKKIDLYLSPNLTRRSSTYSMLTLSLDDIFRTIPTVLSFLNKMYVIHALLTLEHSNLSTRICINDWKKSKAFYNCLCEDLVNFAKKMRYSHC
jgi:hypothetical protein